MVKRNRIYGILLLLMMLLPAHQAYAYTDYTDETNYVYSQTGLPIKIPTAYEYRTSILLKSIGQQVDMDITSPTDMFVKDSGELYIVESEIGAILLFNAEFSLDKVLTEFRTKNGEVLTLSDPQGIFVTEGGILYIADTGNSRIIVCDRDGNVSMLVEKPENLLGTDLTSFLPIKVVVDSADRISVVARNINSGIMQFTKEGIFTGYTGAPAVSMDAFTKLLRRFSTEEQKAQMQTYVPTEYNNIKIDANNFIWGTISSLNTDDLINTIYSMDLSGKVTPIKKLNSMGKDVLIRKGVFPPVGEIVFLEDPSKIIDVGLGPSSIYSLLDNSQGRIFTYNKDGILLYVFGNKGTRKGNMQIPTAIDYIDDNILVLDSGLCQVMVYEPTAYGKLLIDAEEYYEAGDYDKANATWKEVAERNSNFQYAYIGLGNALYSSKEYEKAMDYYEYANHQENYSKAKEKLRKETTKDIFPIIFISILIVITIYLAWAIVNKIRRYARGEYRKVRREEEE